MQIAIPYYASPDHSPHLRRQAQTLKAHGLKVWAIGIDAPEGRRYSESSFMDVSIIPMPSWLRRGPLSFLWFVSGVFFILLRRRPDVLQPVDAPALLPATLISFFFRIPLYYFSFEDIPVMPGNFHNPLKRTLWTLVEKIGVWRARAVAVVADVDADSFVSRYRIPRPFVIRNVPAIATLYTGDRLTLRKRFGWNSQHRVLIYHGTFQQGRGIEKMFPLLKKDSSLRYAIAGYGIDEQRLRAMVREQGILTQVGFTGPYLHDDLNLLLQDADLGIMLFDPVSPGFLQALPCKLFECIHAGVPVVASDFPEMRRYILSAGVGVVVDPTNQTIVERTVVDFLGNPKKIARCKDSCMRDREISNWKNESDTYLKFLGIASPKE